MPNRASTLLARLERSRERYGEGLEREKLALLAALERRRLARAPEVRRLHEVLCFLRAYPDSHAVLGQVERMLGAFEERADLRRHRRALADTGIAGTDLTFRFFMPQASWLARRWPQQLRIEWRKFTRAGRLEPLLRLLVHEAEAPALDECSLTVEEWIQRLKGPAETDATFLVRRFGALRIPERAREKLYDGLDVPIRIAPGRGTPARTRAKHARTAVVPQTRPLVRGRPALPADVYRPPLAVRPVTRAEALRLIDLAREAMVTRHRDLDAFSYASPDDVRLIDCGDGLVFACLGTIPERRVLLEAVYGFLTLKNGVPVGYVLASALFGSSEVAYNVFDTYRGAEAGYVYGRVLAMVHHLFGTDAFTVHPYQLGDDNEEGLRSGAWWFYQKMGFRPLDPKALRVMERELARMRARPGHRSSIPTLRKLAAHNVFYFLRGPRSDAIGILELPNVVLRVSAELARRFGADRERGGRTCVREAMERLGVASLRGFASGERVAWERWAPLVGLLGADRWSTADRRALVEVIRAKGSRRESDFVRLFDAHRALRRAVHRLAG